MRASPVVFVVASAALVLACKGSSEPVTPAPASSASSATVSQSVTTGSATPTATADRSSCALWAKGVRRVTTRAQAGRGDFFRELRFDLAAESVEVHDSDPFATGKEEKAPRVLQKTKKLAAAEKDALVKGTSAVCPGADAMKRQCAPGGCSRLEVTDASGATTKVEDPATVQAIADLMAKHFPELR
ncbi:MAG: hypothetical protein JNL38_27190 [Myxococcales bacterium]|nr:hypothetical protein [Myxococcales bacterium]